MEESINSKAIVYDVGWESRQCIQLYSCYVSTTCLYNLYLLFMYSFLYSGYLKF